MANDTSLPFEFRQLHYFAVVAEELNMRRAAERLFISQPPLSRQIKNLEDDLGFLLFERSPRGLQLTEGGERTLAAVRPLLAAYAQACADIKALSTSDRALRLGFTTAFEQGIFIAVEKALHGRFPDARLERRDSPGLIKAVAGGRLDLAFVALPIVTQGLPCVSLGYREPCVLALPASWPESVHERPSLALLNNRPLFWFHRDANPAFFDRMRAVFAGIGFAPILLEEPPEHDVLLSRVASGEAAALFARSFALISRPGVVFRNVLEEDLVGVELGLVAGEGHEDLLESVANDVRRALSPGKSLSVR